MFNITNLAQVFNEMHWYNMCLNLEKCTFRVKGGKYLGFMLIDHDIEANPDKCKVIMNMHSPQTIKEVQRLTRRITLLSRFLPKSFEKAKTPLNKSWYKRSTNTKTRSISSTESSKEKKRCMIAWSMELSKLGLQYKAKGLLRAQCLSNFVVELSNQPKKKEKCQILFNDGSTNNRGEWSQNHFKSTR
ncbi:hypothetical protein CR513_61350, partial [Mucuna pruriens]